MNKIPFPKLRVTRSSGVVDLTRHWVEVKWHGIDKENIINWCEDNGTDDSYTTLMVSTIPPIHKFWFKNEQDALLFKLKWGNKG